MSEAATLGSPLTTSPPKHRKGSQGGDRDFLSMVDKALQYKHHPVHYVERVILPGHPGVVVLPWQSDILDAVAEHPRIAVSAGNGMGKDTVTAWLIEWYLMTHLLARIPCTSAVGRQVKEILFAEVHKWSSLSRMRDYFELQSMSMRVRGHEATWFALGFSSSADDPGQEEAKTEGWHEKYLLFIITEARAADQRIWDAAGKACTLPENKIFAQSVKGVEHGEFYHVFTRDRSTWKTFSFPAAALNPAWTPDAGPETRKYLTVSPLISQESVDEKLRKGEETPIFRAGVLDQFIRSDAQSLIRLQWLNDARSRVLKPKGGVEFGGDVAEGGDASALCARCGSVVLGLEGRHIQDLMETTGWFLAMLRAAKERWDKLPEEERASEPEPIIKVDRIGDGAGVVDRMEEQGANIQGINVGMPAEDPERFVNLKAEIFWALRTRAESGLLDLSRIPESEYQLLVEDLVMMRYHYTSAGKLALELRDETRKRLGRSPDRADALALAFMHAETSALNAFF